VRRNFQGQPATGPGDLAEVQFTSGSVGASQWRTGTFNVAGGRYPVTTDVLLLPSGIRAEQFALNTATNALVWRNHAARTPQWQNLALNAVTFRLRLGIDANQDGAVDFWTRAINDWDAGSLTDDASAWLRLGAIRAVKLALVLEDRTPTREPVAAPGAITLFADLPAALQQTLSVGSGDLRSDARYVTLESTAYVSNLRAR
jgi:hypothetical protein